MSADNLKETSQTFDSNRFANMLGFGRRSTLADERMARSVARPSAAFPSPMGRQSLTSGGVQVDNNRDAHNSFNAFLNKCNRLPEMLNSPRDSLFDMEVQPVRFADVSDSDLSTTGQASRRSSLMMSSSSVVSDFTFVFFFNLVNMDYYGPYFDQL